MIAFYYWIYAATWPWYAISQRSTASFNLLQLSSFITLYSWNTKICETLVTFSFLFEAILLYCPYFTSLIKTRWGGGGCYYFFGQEGVEDVKKLLCDVAGGGISKKFAPLKNILCPPPPAVYIMNAGKTTKNLGHFMVIIGLQPH